MFKVIILLLFIELCFYNILLAQNQATVDSLQEVLISDASKKEKVDTYIRLLGQYQNSDSTKTLNFANQAVDLAKSINYTEGEIQALFGIAWSNMQLGHYFKAEQLFYSIIAKSEEVGYSIGKAKALDALGVINYRQGIYEKAFDFYFKSLRISEKLGNKRRMMSTYMNVGNVYNAQGNYQKALEYNFKSLKIKEEFIDKKALANVYSSIAIIYELQREYEKALDYYTRSLTINKELGNGFGIAAEYNNLGMLYKSKGNYEKALEYASESFNIFYKTGNKAHYSYPMLTIGEIYFEQKKWRAAKDYFIKGLVISRDIGNKPNIKLATGALATIEKELGNYKEAFEYHVLYKQTEDSLKNEEQTKKVTQLEMNYKFEKERDSLQFVNNKERIVLETDIENRRLIQIATFIVLGLSVLVLVILFLYLNIKTRSNKALTAQSEELNVINEEVKQQAQEIILLNKSLEKNLNTTTQNLIVKNEKLIEYAYFNSHETRAPLARILGLIQIVDFAASDTERNFILKKIKENSLELESVIKKMNHILEDADIFNGKEESS